MKTENLSTDELLKTATPRPWKCNVTNPRSAAYEFFNADAHLLVRAVNSFEAMREALKELLKHAEWSGTPRGYEAKDFEPMFERAESALALAEGKAVQS
jgi:hypothetical protein